LKNDFIFLINFIYSCLFLTEHPDIEKRLSDENDIRLISQLNESMPEILNRTADMQDITEYWIIYPHKIQVPLHTDDLLYESKQNVSSALKLGEFIF
jgi:hypothetical protein